MLEIKLYEKKITKISKRDGKIDNFDNKKIILSLKKAFESSSLQKPFNYYESICSYALDKLIENNVYLPTSEQIQNELEHILIKEGHGKVAKTYVYYSKERNKKREENNFLMKIYKDITFKESKDIDIKRENANIDSDTAMGTMLKYGSEGSKYFYETFILDNKYSRAHKNGDIHIHDLDFYNLTTTCCQIDIIKLFENGFSTGHGTLREPNSILSYASLACIAIQSNQNDQHGGQSIPNFDYALAKGVEKTFVKKYIINFVKYILITLEEDFEKEILVVEDILKNKNIKIKMENYKEYFNAQMEELLKIGLKKDLILKSQNFAFKTAIKDTDLETYQAMEAFIHNLNTMHSRAGAQTPFSSINYGTDTSKEGRMVTKNILLALEKGLGNGETPIFPIQIFRVKENINFNKEDKNYDLFKLACKVSSKRLFPNFSFQDASFNLKYYKENKPETEISYMGCRTRVISNIHDKEKEITYGRGNLSFTSINLPRLAIKANKDIDIFFKSLDEMIYLVKDQLLERFNLISNKKVKNFPFLMGQNIWLDSQNLNYEDNIKEVLKHGSITIGFIGLAECLVALLGKHHGECDISRDLGLKIIKHMRSKTDELSQKYLLNFSLIATPAEGLSGRFVNIDKKIFGDIIGVTDRKYYTNSFHIPVHYPISIYEKIKIEAPYHELTNAGHITYVELDGDASKNILAFEKIIRFMKDSNIGYGSINHPIDIDPVCGYRGIINETCPKCKRKEEDIKFQRIRRITGYLVGSLDRFNNAKFSEVEERLKHNKYEH